ncbi:MAG: PAC2 family protein [Chloroflexi bacterium]|nr:PAC2 family protein [Chloroflexota bacterium]
MNALRVTERPELRRPILLAAFGGWGDAGAGPSGAIAYLLGDPPPPACAIVDPEIAFDFTVERPITRRGVDGRWSLEYPEIGFFPISRPGHEHDLLLLRGPEPHTGWPTIARVMADFAADVGVETALTFGAFLGPVSHRRTPIVRRTPNATLDAQLAMLGYEETPYSGPTAFLTALLHALDERSIPAASLWAASPAYLGAPNPAVSLALLEAAERVLETHLEVGRLQGMATDFLRKIETALRANPEVADRLGQMVDMTPPDEDLSAETDEPEIPTGEPDLPSGSDLADALERFFREQRRGKEPPAG